MLGRDGIAEHQSIFFETNAATATVIPAPPVGWYICVFKICGTNEAAANVHFGDTGPGHLWNIKPAINTPFFDEDEYGLFSVVENDFLLLTNPGLNWVRLNLTYEIRPVGI